MTLGEFGNQPQPPNPAGQLGGTIRDRRLTPRGVLPRRLQAWLMIGTAVVILLIILVTGRTQSTPPKSVTARVADAALAPAERIRNFAEQLAAEDAREKATDAQTSLSSAAGRTSSPVSTARAMAVQDQQAQRLSDSLLADNIVFSRRSQGDQPSLVTRGATDAPSARPLGSGLTNAEYVNSQLAALNQSMSQLPPAAALGRGPAAPPVGVAYPSGPAQSPSPAPPAGHLQSAFADGTGESAPRGATAEPATANRAEHHTVENPTDGPRLRLMEGTVIETVLVTRLEGTFAGPVTCMVTTPVYSQDRQHVLIPAGARVLGVSSPVQSWGDSRLAVSFHRLLMPDGHTYSLDLFRALDQAGESGVTENVNHHYLQIFGASIAIGGLSGLAQFGTTSGLASTSVSDQYRQSAGASLASSAGRVLDRFLNVLPTITIREGYRVKVYLTEDFDLPVYGPSTGGVR